MNAGWSWIASPLLSGNLNAAFGDMSGLAQTYDDVIKNQFLFTNYISGVGWFGQLVDVSPFDFYKVRLGRGGSITLTGTPANPANSVKQLFAGWSWVGWPLLVSKPVEWFTAALDDVSRLTTLFERIKSQYQFTGYIPGYGWFGELVNFAPGLGYMVKLSQANTLTGFGAVAPATGRQRQLEAVPVNGEVQRAVGSGGWLVEPDKFEFSMCVVAVVIVDGMLVEDGALAAFVGDEVRGIAKPSSYKAPVGSHKGHRSFNLMVYGYLETEGAAVTFQLRHADGRVSRLAPASPTTFARDAFLGSVVDPFVVTQPDLNGASPAAGH